MSTTRNRLGRRTLLRGAFGGAAVCAATPLLDIMLDAKGTALADGAPIPKRLGLWFWGNGYYKPVSWAHTPSNGGWGPANAESDFAPLGEANVTKDLTLLTGFMAHENNEMAHHCGRASILTGTWNFADNNGGAAGPFGPSFTHVLAKEWKGRTQIDSLDLKICRNGFASDYRSPAVEVFDDIGKQMDGIASPMELYNTLFGAGTPNPPTPGVTPTNFARTKRAVLDAIMGDAADLKRRHLGRTDSHRLDAHLQHIADVEDRLFGDAAVVACDKPNVIPGSAESYEPDALRCDYERKHKDMTDLLALALVCDQTRVFTMTFSGMQTNAYFFDHTQGEHEISHALDKDKEIAEFRAITRAKMKVFARFVQALAGIAEGDGTLLDHCAVLCTSETSTWHGYTDMPLLIAGTAGGALKKGAVVGAEYTAQHTSHVILTLLQAVGSNATSFGSGRKQNAASPSDGSKKATTTLSGLMA